MRYLKTYEDLKQIDNVVDIIKTNCTEWSPNDPCIYRGFMGEKINKKSYIFTPFSYEDVSDGFYKQQNHYNYKGKEYRGSAYTDNYYTMIINHSEPWSDFPKRELICSFKKVYGGQYRVIPFDGSKWGIVPMTDIQNSMRFTVKVNYEEHTCISIDDINDGIRYDWKLDYDVPDDVEKFLDWIEEDGNDFFGEDGLNPYDLNFSVRKYKELINGDFRSNEIWTDSKCVLIEHDFYDKIKDKL